MLEVAGLTVRFGGVTALHDVELTVDDGSGVRADRPQRRGQDDAVQLRQPPRGAGRGLDPLRRRRGARASARTRSPSSASPARSSTSRSSRALTVRENVMLGAHHRHRSGFVAAALQLPLVQREEAAMTRRRRRGAGARGPHRDRRPSRRRPRLRPAQARRAGPRAVRDAAAAGLDEPASGLSHGEVDELADAAQAAHAELELTLLIVEHHMGLVMRVSDKVVGARLRPHDRRGRAARRSSRTSG